MATITLWHLPGSPPSWAVRIMADILGLNVETKDVNIGGMEHKSPEFRKINPMGTIPVIKDGDFIISESHTIMKYLLDKYGNEEQKKKLYPSDRKLQALVDQAMYFDTGVAFTRVKNIALPSIFEGQDGVTPKNAKESDDAYDVVEMYLADKDYVAINEFTMADISLGTTVVALDGLHALDKKRFPRTAAWVERLSAMPGFKNIALPGTQALSAVVKSCWENNKKK